MNREIKIALKYHANTRHTPISVRTSGHVMDFGNKPLPYKVYTQLPPIPLPRDLTPLTQPALQALSSRGDEPEGERLPDLDTVARLLYHSAGITKIFRYANGTKQYFRAAACTGALYEIDLYLVCRDLPELGAGVYHYSPHDHALRLLRQGDFRQVLGDVNAPAVVVCSGTYWRNSWKYQARTYRHFGWDNGTLLANLLADASGNHMPVRIQVGFVDDQVNRLLDLNTEKEVATCMVSVGRSVDPLPAAPELSPLGYEIMPLSRRGDVDYPLMLEMQRASSLGTAEEVWAWRGCLSPRTAKTSEKLPQPLDAPDPVEDVILRRGSSRRFNQDSITLEQLSTVLQKSAGVFDADFLQEAGNTLNEIYLIVNAVEGLTPGAYYYDGGSLELLKDGDFRTQAGFLDLEQELAEDAAVNVYFMADLPAILKRFGNRGYRAVQLEAGILGGKMYLASYALRLGATGLTFFDDEVTEFFSHAAGKSTIFLVAIGHPWQKETEHLS